jgi:hypothetical protein
MCEVRRMLCSVANAAIRGSREILAKAVVESTIKTA